MGDRWRPATGEEWLTDTNKRLDMLERRPKGIGGGGPNGLFQTGRVSTTYTGGTPTVTLSDGRVITNVNYIAPYRPLRGQDVQLETIRGQLTIIGPEKPTIWADVQFNTAQYPALGSWNSNVIMPEGGYYGKVQVGKTADGVVMMRGLMTVPTGNVIPANGLILTLPPEFRPPWRVDFGFICGIGVGQWSIDTNGELRSIPGLGGSAGVSFFSIGNIIYNTNPDLVWTNLAPILTNGWTPYVSAGYPAPGYAKDKNGIVWKRGLITHAAPAPSGVTAQPFTFPVGYRPALTQHQFSSANNLFTSFQFNLSGLVSWQGGSYAPASLEGMPHVASDTFLEQRNLNVPSPWANYAPGNNFTFPSFFRTPEGLVLLRGLIAGGTTQSFAFMPPDASVTFLRLSMLHNQSVGLRFDMEGRIPRVSAMSGSVPSGQWISLDNAFWIAEDMLNPAY